VSRIEDPEKPLEQADVADVADRDGGYGQNGRPDDPSEAVLATPEEEARAARLLGIDDEEAKR
jgi:hypothetical protein